MMRNGIYLVLILFLGSVGFYAVNGLYLDNSIMLASVVFLVVSLSMAYLTTHFKKHRELTSAPKIINVIYITLFALYGIVIGLNVMNSVAIESMMVRFGGIIFLAASVILLFGVMVFMKQKMLKGM